VSKIFLRVCKGAAMAFLVAVAVRFGLGGYGGVTEFMLLFVVYLGALTLALPALASAAYLLWSLIRLQYAEAVGAALAMFAGLVTPFVQLQSMGHAMPELSTQVPQSSVLVFGPDMECYGSSACGSELLRAGFTIGAAGQADTNYAAPETGDKIYLSAYNKNVNCKTNGKDRGQGYGLSSECVIFEAVPLPSDFVYLSRRIDSATDDEIFTAVKNTDVIATSSRQRVTVMTWSPYYFLGRLDNSLGVVNKQAFISKMTGVALGE
jgi:hypothetical protein